jgi:hypothetical protein
MTSQNKMSFFVVPIGLVAVSVAFVLCALYFPGILTGPTQSSLAQMADLHASTMGDSNVGRAWAALYLQAPYLLTFLSSLYVVTLLSSSLMAETHKGGIEMLLAEPYSPRQIVAAFFWNSVLISFVVWTVTGVLFAIAAVILTKMLGLTPPQDVTALALTVMLPLAGMLWAAQIVMVVHLLFPKMSAVQVGTGRGLLNYAATSPTIAVFMLITFVPSLEAVTVASGFLISGLIGAIVISSVLSRAFRPEVLLENT